jgi:hypothetical protein
LRARKEDATADGHAIPAPEESRLRVSLHLDGRRLLRADIEDGPRGPVLVEDDGGRVSPDFPIGCLIDGEDLIRLEAAGDLPMEIFCEGTRRMRLLRVAEPGCVRIMVETDAGILLDVHRAPISALLPRLRRAHGS